jgi:hypothetical protein
VRQLTLEHQSEEIATDCAGARQTIFRPKNNLRREAENLAVNRGTDHSRNIFMFGHESSRYDNVKSGLGATLRNLLPCSVEFATPHERVCSAINARA